MKIYFPKKGKIQLGHRKAFTLVETLVAVAILMISIAGPLVVANKGLVAAMYAKDQSVATFLAQEGMELIRNMKDQAIYTDTNGFSNFILDAGPGDFGACQGSDSYCGVYADGTATTHLLSCKNDLTKCILYQTTNWPQNYVNFNSDLGDIFSQYQPTIFNRHFYWNQVDNNEIQVVVIVGWKTGTIYNEVILSSDMVAKVL